MLLVAILFILIHAGKFWDLIHIWISNEDYGHGFLILPICLYLVWRKKDELYAQSVNSSWWGYILLLFWIISYGIGTIGQISTFDHISIILFPLAAVSILTSTQALTTLLFPILYMVFMFPIPSEIYTRITNPLMLFATSISFHFLEMMKLPVLQEGNILTLPNYTMQVVQACSGIRSLITIMAMVALMGYIMISSNILRIIFFLISIPLAIFCNSFRIVTTALLAYYISSRAAEGFSHTFAGIATFMLSFIILFGSMEILIWLFQKKERLHS